MTTMMISSAKPVFRVHAAGLTAVETAVLGGLLHLAEAQGVRFRMESQADSAHIFVLDPCHPCVAELRRTVARFDERVIWVDPSSAPNTGKEIKRPVRWPALLDLMVQTGREYGKPSKAAAPRPVAQIGFGRLCSLCEIILRAHFGPAAERLVRQARAEIEAIAATNRQIGTHVFLDALKKQFPEPVKGEKILREIAAAVARATSRTRSDRSCRA